VALGPEPEPPLAAATIERLGKALMLVALAPALLSVVGMAMNLGPAFIAATFGAVAALGVLGLGVLGRRVWAAWATAALAGAATLSLVALLVSALVKGELDGRRDPILLALAVGLLTASRLFARVAKSLQRP